MRRRVMLQIPRDIVRNNGYNINASEFALYAYLKNVYFNTKQNPVVVSKKQTMHGLGISDLRTFKKMLSGLYREGLIKTRLDTIPHHDRLELEINVHAKSTFVQLPCALLSRIPEIGHVGFRLLYLYESYINRAKAEHQFSFVSYKEIAKTLKISEPTIAKYNSILVEAGLLVVHKHGFDFGYNDSGKPVLHRYNNHYVPVVSKMIA